MIECQGIIPEHHTGHHTTWSSALPAVSHQICPPTPATQTSTHLHIYKKTVSTRRIEYWSEITNDKPRLHMGSLPPTRMCHIVEKMRRWNTYTQALTHGYTGTHSHEHGHTHWHLHGEPVKITSADRYSRRVSRTQSPKLRNTHTYTAYTKGLGRDHYIIIIWSFALKPSRDLNLEVLLNSDAYGRLNGPKKMRSNKTSSSPSQVKSIQEPNRGSSKGSYRPGWVELYVHTQ